MFFSSKCSRIGIQQVEESGQDSSLAVAAGSKPPGWKVLGLSTHLSQPTIVECPTGGRCCDGGGETSPLSLATGLDANATRHNAETLLSCHANSSRVPRQIVLALPSIPRKFDSRRMSGDSPFTPRILMGAYSWLHTGLVAGMQPCIYTVCMDTRYCGPHGGPILGLVVGPRGPLHTHSG